MVLAWGYRLIVFHCSVEQIKYFNRFLLFRKDTPLTIPKYFRFGYLGTGFNAKYSTEVSTRLITKVLTYINGFEKFPLFCD